MKNLLRQCFRPLLAPLERGEGPYAYKPLNRKVLIALGTLFTLLALAVLAVALGAGELGYLLPVLVFGVAGGVALVVGTLGSDRAVSRLWGNR